ncbi:MAG: ParB/RepB/Spo0J family partition protein, partial [Opitutaceae bacterium]|nr:ParB/RepB/Spo0J family partition protein [Opitutaceae bacterium]
MTENIQLQLGDVKELPVDLIQEDPNQPREDFNEEKIEGLAASIKNRRARGLRGLIQPIKVTGGGLLGGYIIKSGANRYRATLRAGEDVIACELDDETEDAAPADRLIDQVSENYNRSDLNPIELAKVIDRLRNECGLTLKETEDRLNGAGIKLQRGALTNTHRLLKLPEWAQDAIRQGELTPAHGKYLLQVDDCPELLDEVHEWLSEFRKEEERSPTTAELQDQIGDMYGVNFPRIPKNDAYRWSGKFGYIGFDTAACLADCKKARKLGTEGNTYCGDLECFGDKVAAHEEQKAERTR